MDKTMLKQYDEKMSKTINVFGEELATLRAGRANPGILNKLVIDYYGVPTPVTQVGSVSVPEARTIVFQAWDASVLKEVEKAILKSDIGINPNNDGKSLRLTFPPLTEDRRKELTKTVRKYGEEAKVAVRTVRRDAMEHLKKSQKDGILTEDDLKLAEKDMQNLTDKKITEIDKLITEKEKEIMEI